MPVLLEDLPPPPLPLDPAPAPPPAPPAVSLLLAALAALRWLATLMLLATLTLLALLSRPMGRPGANLVGVLEPLVRGEETECVPGEELRSTPRLVEVGEALVAL